MFLKTLIKIKSEHTKNVSNKPALHRETLHVHNHYCESKFNQEVCKLWKMSMENFSNDLLFSVRLQLLMREEMEDNCTCFHTQVCTVDYKHAHTVYYMQMHSLITQFHFTDRSSAFLYPSFGFILYLSHFPPAFLSSHSSLFLSFSYWGRQEVSGQARLFQA